MRRGIESQVQRNHKRPKGKLIGWGGHMEQGGYKEVMKIRFVEGKKVGVEKQEN